MGHLKRALPLNNLPGERSPTLPPIARTDKTPYNVPIPAIGPINSPTRPSPLG